MLIVSFDGSSIKDQNGNIRTGIGYIIKDTLGNKIESRAKNVKGCRSYKAEYLALEELSKALVRIQPKGMVIIRGDADFVINHVKDLYNDKEIKRALGYSGIAKRIVKNLKSTTRCHYYFMWVPRDQNKDADRISGRASGKYSNLFRRKKSGRNRTNKRPRKNLRVYIPIQETDFYNEDIS